jgi:hypothetical protein
VNPFSITLFSVAFLWCPVSDETCDLSVPLPYFGTPVVVEQCQQKIPLESFEGPTFHPSHPFPHSITPDSPTVLTDVSFDVSSYIEVFVLFFRFFFHEGIGCDKFYTTKDCDVMLFQDEGLNESTVGELRIVTSTLQEGDMTPERATGQGMKFQSTYPF